MLPVCCLHAPLLIFLIFFSMIAFKLVIHVSVITSESFLLSLVGIYQRMVGVGRDPRRPSVCTACRAQGHQQLQQCAQPHPLTLDVPTDGAPAPLWAPCAVPHCPHCKQLPYTQPKSPPFYYETFSPSAMTRLPLRALPLLSYDPSLDL